MHNIIFTKVSAILAATVMVTGSLEAQGGPSLGCYARDYTDAHLASQPAQVVDQIILRVRRDDSDSLTVADMAVVTANQGHVVKNGLARQHFDQFLVCWQDGSRSFCGVECDGGKMEITHDTGKMLQFRTKYLIVGDRQSCGGPLDLAEVPGEMVPYRLYRVSDAVCSGF